MRYIACLLFFSLFASQAHGIEWAGEYGQGFYSLKDTESISKNQIFSLRIQNSNPHWFTYGLGYQQQKLQLNFSQGLYAQASLTSHSIYLYLSPRYQFSQYFDLALENKIILNEPLQTGMNSNQRFFAGVGMGFRNNIDHFNYRIALNIQQGLEFSNTTTLALLSLEIKFKEPPIRTPATIASNSPPPPPPLKIATVVSNFGYKKSSVTVDSHLQKLLTKINNSTYTKIILVGHTDTVGSQEYNYQLGLERAEFIKNLISNSITGKIEVRSEGKLNPVSNQDSQNRRVEMFLELDRSLPENQELLQLTGAE